MGSEEDEAIHGHDWVVEVIYSSFSGQIDFRENIDS
jgi:6-pyruvoyl-tetrahydropterin synthase